MYVFAYTCLLAALLAAFGGGGLALLQLWQNRADLLPAIERCNWLVSAGLALASALLLHALFWEDYRLEYVASYTDSLLPVFYRLTAFWAGQPGSMLFWALACAICGALFHLMPSSARLGKTTRLWFWSFFYANMAFFCLLLTSWSNPFIMQQPVPVDGNGLNPLLQNPGMIFHPPLLFMGYAGFCVPACLALAQLLSQNDGETPWFRSTRPFIILAWTTLTAGIVLGAWWAYMELGWGGYWAWDPVENASLLPWLTACAALHVLAARGAEGKLGRTAALLMALTVVSAFFATYLTRSGVIQSVHAFGDGGVGTPLAVFVAAFFFLALFIACASPAKGPALASPFSREGLLVLVAWIFLALTAIILLATMWPVISGLAGASARGLDASFYNRVCLPLGVVLLLALCACPWLGRNGGLAPNHGAARLYVTCGAFMASLAAIWLAGYRQPLALVAAAASTAVFCAMPTLFLKRGIWGDKRALSAAGAHMGMALLAFGVAFSGPYTVEKELLLAKGQQDVIGPYTVALQDVKDGSGPGYDYLKTSLKISENGREIGVVSPERRIYAKFGSMQISEVDVISSFRQDIYASLLGMDEDYRVLVKLSLEPMVNWIWIGGALMCLLPLAGIGRRGLAGSSGQAGGA